jgi:hypothetical protein
MAMAMDESVKRSNGEKAALKLVDSSRQVTLDWLNVYAQVYREMLTPELILAYQTSLVQVKADILHKAFLRAMRASTFRPTPAEVLQAAAVEIENAPKPKQLELHHELTPAEREEIEKAFSDLAAKLGIQRKAKVDEDKRRRELAGQKEEILRKYPSPLRTGRKQG